MSGTGEGFYKSCGDGVSVFYAPTSVTAPAFTLLAENHAGYTYPQDGWAWFDSEDAARTAFGLPSVESLIPPALL